MNEKMELGIDISILLRNLDSLKDNDKYKAKTTQLLEETYKTWIRRDRKRVLEIAEELFSDHEKLETFKENVQRGG